MRVPAPHRDRRRCRRGCGDRSEAGGAGAGVVASAGGGSTGSIGGYSTIGVGSRAGTTTTDSS